MKSVAFTVFLSMGILYDFPVRLSMTVNECSAWVGLEELVEDPILILNDGDGGVRRTRRTKSRN